MPELEGDGGSPSGLRQRLGVAGGNLAAWSAAQILARGLGVFQVIVLARVLGPDRYGLFAAVLAYLALAMVIGGMGVDALTLRDLARTRTGLGERYRALLTLRALGAVVAAIGLMAFAVGAGRQELGAFAVVSAAILPAALAGSLSNALQAQERFLPPSIATVVAAALMTAWTVATALADAPLAVILAGPLVSNTGMALVLIRPARAAGLGGERMDLEYARDSVGDALRYWALALLGIVYMRIDLVMLDQFGRGPEVGYYAAAYQLFEAVLLPKTLLLAVLTPRLSRFQFSDRERARIVYRATTRLLAWGGVLLAGIGWLAAPPVVLLLYGAEFRPAIDLLRVLLITLGLAYVNGSNGAVLSTGGNLGRVLLPWFVATALNAGLNLLWIPRYGGVGAAWAMVVAEALLLAMYTALVCSRLGIPARTYVRTLLRPPLDLADVRHGMAGVDPGARE